MENVACSTLQSFAGITELAKGVLPVRGRRLVVMDQAVSSNNNQVKWLKNFFKVLLLSRTKTKKQELLATFQ